MTKNINEGLERSDLARLVNPRLHIDEFKSKLGRDEDVCVLSFKVSGGKEPALDLTNFAEKGYGWVIDADTSPGEFEDGDFLVFIEAERTKDLPKQIVELIGDLLNLTDQNIDQWEFFYHKSSKSKPITVDNLASAIPLTPNDYKKLYGREAIDNLKAAAGVEVDTKAPTNAHTESLRIAAGLK